MASEEENVEHLSKIFQDGLDLFNNIDKTDEPTNSLDVQTNIKRAMALLEKATRLASVAGLFSSNESMDEIATSDLQYLLLPALLGTLSLKLTTGERREIVNVAEIYFRDFMQRCHDYGLTDYTVKEPKTIAQQQQKSQLEYLTDAVYSRHSKIERFNEEKKLQSQLNELKTNMANKNVDDEIKRNYILTMVKIFILKSIMEIESIEMEKPMLAHMDEVASATSTGAKKREPPKPKPLKPVILTKDEVQKAVFGLGYPSIPTMTVKEFYDKRVQDGVFPDPEKVSQTSMSLQAAALAGIQLDDEQEQIEKEKNIEDDDPEMLERLRNRDEFKDDHRRGWGNRMNRS